MAYAVQYSAVQYSTVQYSAVQYGTVHRKDNPVQGIDLCITCEGVWFVCAGVHSLPLVYARISREGRCAAGTQRMGTGVCVRVCVCVFVSHNDIPSVEPTLKMQAIAHPVL